MQGVGLRPALYRLATARGLSGSVENRAGTVVLRLAGPADDVERLAGDLPGLIPSPARIDRVELQASEPEPSTAATDTFRILPSTGADTVDVLIPADLRICDACRREVLDPAQRRYGYPFTTCTDCGPRYTVLAAMPYDRERTTLRGFPLCDACRREYNDPEDRRFHAETLACPACGPRVVFAEKDDRTHGAPALRRARAALHAGRIVAVRGLGGFLLAADAFNRETLARLRARKQRPHKPLAVMARDLDTVRAFCRVDAAARDLLLSPAAPIVILDRLPDAPRSRLPADLVTPDTRTLGVMLPTSPLHLLLFEPLNDDTTPPLDLLIMTSGNRRAEPICLTEEEARGRLHDIADAYLSHDRPISLRNDDSLCVIREGRPQVWRRARGFAPRPVRIRPPVNRTVLAMGAELKNAVALAYGDQAVLSPHVGDLETPEAVDALAQTADTLCRFLDRDPEVVAVDRHPDMHATRTGRAIADRAGVPCVPIQHHHAHAVACLAEHGRESGLALLFDGTGLGDDGHIWGAELLEVSPRGYRRLATFRPCALPGGDAAVREPVRQAVARWIDAGCDLPLSWLAARGAPAAACAAWTSQCRQRLHAPPTHAAGRLLDAFSVILGCAPARISYEGQPPIRLEALARLGRPAPAPRVPYDTDTTGGLLHIDWRPAFRRFSDPRCVRGNEADWALGVHTAVASAALDMVSYAFDHTAERAVALSGGVFMNALLHGLVSDGLRAMGATVYVHRDTPPNDGCIALGQAVVAGRANEAAPAANAGGH